VTRQTALELIRHLDVERVLAVAGRVNCNDLAATRALWERVAAEDARARQEPGR
jgi:hypothetical protein